MLVLGLVDIPWWGLILLVIVGYAIYSTRHFNAFKGLPRSLPLPIVGTSLPIFFKSLAELDLEKIHKHNGKGVSVEFAGPKPVLVPYDEDFLSDIMVKKFSSFRDRIIFDIRSPSNIAASMLLNLKGDHWKHVRNEMTPSFTSGKLKKMSIEVNRCGKQLANSLLENVGHEVDVITFTGAFTMDVIASTAFGIRLESQKDKENAFVIHARKAFNLEVSPIFIIKFFIPELAALLEKIGIGFKLIPQDVQDFFYNITRQTMSIRTSEHDKGRADFLQLMINAQKGENILDENSEEHEQGTSIKGLSTNEILANALIFFTAGYDTTATSLSYFIYNMAMYPEIQERLMEEIKKVVGTKELIDYNLIADMPYLEQCVLENLRLYPPLVRANREATEDVTINGIFIKKGTYINIPILGVQRDPNRWPDPMKFDPDRFLPERKNARSPYHFLTFGAGPRNCIGMRLALLELKIAIIHILRAVQVSKCPQTMDPIKYSRKGGIVLRPEGGIHVKVDPRDT